MRVLQMALVAVMSAWLPTAQAADPPPPGVIGQDALGDKGRSGPDGWSWAPVTRGTTAAATPNATPDPGADRTRPAGEDPGTPSVAQAKGPGTVDRPGVPQ